MHVCELKPSGGATLCAVRRKGEDLYIVSAYILSNCCTHREYPSNAFWNLEILSLKTIQTSKITFGKETKLKLRFKVYRGLLKIIHNLEVIQQAEHPLMLNLCVLKSM